MEVRSLVDHRVAKAILQQTEVVKALLYEECPKHHGHKGGEPGVTPWTCGAIGERAQMILMWVRASSVGNASHPRRLGGMSGKP